MMLFFCTIPSARTGIFFFFSSRRRHTRFSRDWSSDVCSSDLQQAGRARPGEEGEQPVPMRGGEEVREPDEGALQRRIDREQSGEVRAGADERHVAEGEDPGVAGEELQRHDEHDVDEEVAQLALVSAPRPAPDRNQEETARDRERAERGLDRPVTADAGHVSPSVRPTSPCGRKSRTPTCTGRTHSSASANAWLNCVYVPCRLAS